MFNKKNLKRILVLCILLLLLPALSYAAGTVTYTQGRLSGWYDVITITWIADASAATVPDTAINIQNVGYVVLAVTNPGSPAPTDNYDIVLTDDQGVDIMGGNLANRDTANTEQTMPKIGGAFAGRFVDKPFTFGLSGNSVNSATGVLKLIIAR